jgi:hypothetical protein
MQHRFGLFEVDNVDPVADAEDVGRHLGVPPAGVMAEMHAGFEQLAHGIGWDSHNCSLFPVEPPQVRSTPDASGRRHRSEALHKKLQVVASRGPA